MIIYKYFDKYLEKSFIKANKSSAIVSIFLIYKLRKDIYIYIDYKSLNNVIVKNRYPILLICETFDILYHVKIYTNLILLQRSIVYISFPETNRKLYSLSDLVYSNVWLSTSV